MIGESAERFFHVVLNGLYTFRFRSEFAVEVRYLSRLSSPEMAALNFTLDESQELKTTYNQMLNASGDPNPDLIVALGELYEFDQAYDIARSYYNRALKMIDDEFARQFGVDFLTPPRAEDAKTAVRRRRQNTVTVNVEEDHDTMPFYAAILSRRLEEPGMLNGFMPWVVRRLRLMMSIGLTHEQSNDSERAQMSYHAAQAFAVSILEIINESERPGVEKFLQRQALKHLDLLFQPMFAAAWVEEKLPSGVDTALTRVELELHRLRRNLDFVNIAKELPEDDLFGDVIPETLDIKNSFFERGQSSNNSVVMSELHNKAGDLYFFKGREARSVSPRGTGTSHCRLRSAIEDEMRMVGTDMLFTHKEDGKSRVSGYLLMSHYHYALALHEVRRFLVYRRKWSRTFLDIGHTEQNKDPAANEKQAEWRLPTITGYSIPTYVALTIMSSLGDLSDVTLARASLLAIWEELRRADKTGKGHDPSAHGPITADAMREVLDIKPAQFATSFEEWLADTDEVDSDKVRPVVSDFLGSWFGEEQNQKDTSEDKPAKLKLRFGKVSPHSKVTIVGLFASMTAARFATRANYPDTAGYEYQISAEHSVRLLKGFRSMMVFGKLQPQPCEHKGLEQIYPDGFDFTPSQLHLEYFAKIAEIGVDALTRQMASIENAYPLSTAKPTADAAKEHMAIEENLSTLSVATALALQLETLSLLETSFDPDVAQSGQMLDKVRESLKRSVSRINKLSERYNWFGSEALRDAVDVSFLNGQAYQRINQHLVGVSTDPQFRQMLQISMDRATCHAQLLHIVTQHRYPVLNNMRALKALIDDSIMSHFGFADQFIETSLGNVALWSGTNVSEYCLQAANDIEHERSSRFNQARLWVEELIELETFVDASMNFPPSMMAETVGLLCVALTRFEPKIEESEVRALRPMARRYRWRAEQSFTMGRQYYQNISRLYYLFDDFNDRRRHANHGAQMCMADQLALLRFALDDRMSQV